MALLAGLALAVLVPIGLVLWRFGFNGLYGQDPYAYLDYSLGPLMDNLQVLQPPPQFFWPPGYPLLVAAASLLTGPVPQAGQLVSLAAGALVPVFTTLLAWEVWPENGLAAGEGSSAAVPLLAGLLVALTGQLWQSSAVVMADTSGLAAAVLGALALARYGNQMPVRGMRAFPWLLLAAGALAFAILTRWAYALVAIPLTGYALLLLARQQRRAAVLQAFLAGAVALLVLSPLLPALLPGSGLAPSGHGGFRGDLQVYRWDPRAAFRRVHLSPDGVLRYRLPNGLYYALAPAHWFMLTPLIALAALPGLWRAWVGRSAAVGTFLFLWPGVVFAFHAGTPWQNLRFTLAYLPPVAILAAGGTVWLYRAVGRRGRPLILAGLILGLAWMAYGGWSLTSGLIRRQAGELAAVRWADARVPPGARVLTFGITLTFQHNSPLEVRDLFGMAPAGLDSFLASGPETYLLLDVENVESQWAGLSPGQGWAHLREKPGVVPLGRYGNYTLYRLKGGG